MAMNPSLDSIFPLSCRLAGALPRTAQPADFPACLRAHSPALDAHPYLPDLATLEYARHQLAAAALPFPATVAQRTLNPTVRIVEVEWAGLPEFLRDQTIRPQRRAAMALLYRPHPRAEIEIVTPTGHDLLALKMVLEGLDSREVAIETGVTLGRIDEILETAANKGLLLAPPSSLVRDPSYGRGRALEAGEAAPTRVATFALQWHLTQTCDLHCRHCYDRSTRTEMSFPQALHVLDELYAFSQVRHVHAQVSFSGGNPMLSPHFFELYREAADRGFLVAILGNPMAERFIERLLAIRRPEFYQVSLEGLQAHNDDIRGAGHFDRTLAFLDLLRRHSIYAMVMLTLTGANCDQVLPLADLLRGRADLFTFNRLAMVGEGAALASVAPDRFRRLLAEFLAVASREPHLSLKDNFFNLVLAEQHRPLTGGCTGFGCGAAFNFVSVLPDGEVHACRKFPSPIGNLLSQSLADIYDGAAARQYRAGSSACLDCDFRPLCRGCAAVTHGFGRNVFTDLDPYCFKDDRPAF